MGNKGRLVGKRVPTMDHRFERMVAQQHRTQDSTLAYYVNQLENLDRKQYEPLVSVSWARDIMLRPGVTLDEDTTSFIRSAFAGAGSLSNSQGNMPWISPESNDIVGVDVNGQKIVTPLRPLARELSYSSIQLRRSQRTGQPIDTQKLAAINELYQMNIDQMVYVGDDAVAATGLVNNADVTAGTVDNGASGSPLWSTKTPDEIVQDIDNLLVGSWEDSGFAVCPRKVLLPTTPFAYIASQKVSSAGNVSILKYVIENCISTQINGAPLDIQPLKWLNGAGVDDTNRMLAYTNDLNYVRFPMVPMYRENAYYQGLKFIAPYVYAFGQIEFVYPETVQYADGI